MPRWLATTTGIGLNSMVLSSINPFVENRLENCRHPGLASKGLFCRHAQLTAGIAGIGLNSVYHPKHPDGSDVSRSTHQVGDMRYSNKNKPTFVWLNKPNTVFLYFSAAWCSVAKPPRECSLSGEGIKKKAPILRLTSNDDLLPLSTCYMLK